MQIDGATERDTDTADGLSIGALSRATGISIHSLRMWERRYGAPRSFRRPSGHRRYPHGEVPRLRAVARAIAAGFRAGEVAASSLEQIDTLFDTLKPAAASAGAGPRDARFETNLEIAAVVSSWVDAARRFDDDFLSGEFQDHYVRLGTLAFLQNRAVPLLKGLGEEWQCGRLTVSAEHFASGKMSDFLAANWRAQNALRRGAPLLLATLPKDQHALGLQMAALVATAAEQRVLYLGPETPTAELVDVALAARACGVCISISSTMQARSAARTVQEIRDLLPPEIALICGGAAAPQGIGGVERIVDFQGFFDWLRAFRRRVIAGDAAAGARRD